MSFTRVEQNGVEFYTLKATGESGMSIRGLARLCGVNNKTIADLLKSIVRGLARSERLKRFAGQDLYCGVKAPKGAKIIRAEVCSAIVRYYALDSGVKNETALFAFDKFADIGMQHWIQTITGWTALPPKQELTLESAEKLLKSRLEVGTTAVAVNIDLVLNMLRQNEFSADGLRLYFYLEMISLQNKTPDVATICQDLNIARSTFNKWLPKVHENTNCANWIEPTRRKGPEYVIQLRLHQELGGKMEAYTPIGPMVYDRP
jgi:hypothetical protein